MSTNEAPVTRDGRLEVRAGRAWRREILLYLAVAVLVTLPGLGSTALLDMEAMIADMGTTVLESGEMIVTRLYGELHTYKPPFVYWLTAASFAMAGRSELALRLPAALSTLGLGLAVLFLVGRAIRPRTGLLAGLAAISTGLFLQEAKQGEFDAVVAAAVGVAVAAACHNLVVERANASFRIWLLCYLALATGVLTKGGLALMAFGPGLLVAAWMTGRTRRLWRWDHLVAAAACAAIVAGYLWLLWTAVGPAAFEQPLEEAGRRSLQWTPRAVARTLVKPVWIAAAFLPWSLAWPWSWRRRSGDGEPGGQVDAALARMSPAGLGFLVGGILTFMAVPTSHTRYYIPLAAACGIVAACGLERLASRPSRAALGLALGLAAAVASAAIGLGFLAETGLAGRAATAAIGVAALVGLWRLARSTTRYRIAWILLAAALCFWSAETWVLRPHRAVRLDLSPVARELAPEIPPGEFVWAFGAAEPVGDDGSLYYYLDRKVRTIRPGDDLPAPGSFVIVRAEQVEGLSPAIARRLELIRRVEHPWKVFLLYRVVSGAA